MKIFVNMNIAVLCPAVVSFDVMKKTSMCGTSIYHTISQPFPAQWVGGWGGVGLGVDNLVPCSNFEQLYKQFQTSHSN